MAAEEITRIINWNATDSMVALLYAGAAVAVIGSVSRLASRVLVWRRGLPLDERPTWREALANLARWVAGRGKMNRDPYAAVMHDLILWGFIILFIGTTLVFLEHDTPLHFFYGTFYLIASCVVDLGGLAFLIGLGMALHRRYVRASVRLKKSAMADAMLGLLVVIGLSGFALEAARIGVELPSFERASVVGYPIALILRGLGIGSEGLQRLHRALWAAHGAVSVAFFALGTAYFFRHVVVSALAVALAPRRTTGRLRPYALLQTDSTGRGRASDLVWKDLLDADACTTCGRCTSVCPATAAGKALDPRGIVLKLADLVGRSETMDGRASAYDRIAPQELWDCTTCGACNHACPVDIQVFDKIIDLRRQLVDLGDVSPSGQASLEALQTRQNPWDYAPAQRALWRETLKLPVAAGDRVPEWIYWVGCAGAFEPTAQSISRSTAAVLQAAGVDFAVLASESCTGDPARRLGDEALFQSCRRRNLELLRASGARKVVTHCPHCMNTFRNEYPENGKAEFEVAHHSQLIGELIAQERVPLRAAGMAEKVTFHDPCYLGRHNGEYDAPRALVDAVPGLDRVEMPRTREGSFCCGGGGGQMWLESSGATRVEGLRLEEARSTGATLVATGCPFCKIMLESAAATAGRGDAVRVRDVAEIVHEALDTHRQ